MPEESGLNLGWLLRMQAMVEESAQVEATYQAAAALVEAYMGLRGEMQRVLGNLGLSDLSAEFDRLFLPIGPPPEYSPAVPSLTGPRLLKAASAAQLNLRKLQGWIQGLINELTLEQRLRMEAEAAAGMKKPPMGFAPD
jgi:hypothetical protein